MRIAERTKPINFPIQDSFPFRPSRWISKTNALPINRISIYKRALFNAAENHFPPRNV